jgi:hypothetical protein
VRLLEDPVLREKLSSVAVGTVGQMTWELAAEKTREVLGQVVAHEAGKVEGQLPGAPGPAVTDR